MTSITRWVLAHKRIVVGFWVVLTLVGGASAGSATKALKQKFSVPGKEGFQTNQQIARDFHGTGGNGSPLLAVVTLPASRSVDSSAVQSELRAVEARLTSTLPGVRLAGWASTHNAAFLSSDRHTTFVIAYPRPDPTQAFEANPEAAKHASAALAGTTVAGAPVHLTGFDALSNQSGGGKGPGVLLEAMLGGLGALLVLAFVFGSFLALVPILMAIVSILTCFLVVWGLTTITEVSPIVQFLIALIGLGVSIDYSLIVVVRWREERAHGASGEEAIERAMTTAGRAVVFSGTTVAIGLFALIALPVPFLRSVGYGGMLIPLISVIVAMTLLPVVLSKLGPRLDWPHIRNDNKASRAWTGWANRSCAGAGWRHWAPGSCWQRWCWPQPACSWARPTRTRSPRKATPRRACWRWSARASARACSCPPRCSSAGRRPRPRTSPRSSPRCPESTARSRRRCPRGAVRAQRWWMSSPPPTPPRQRGATRSNACRLRRTPPARKCAWAASARRTRTSSKRCTATSR